ncbi:DUF4912 domain-containing protein [Mahella sp.]|uniref:DUF4912 domain-containing protein n=1 Tax=Mahella sp. TaxID=2798721 RepID=UPI0025BDD878|nr:DUF4912 domain-containing protein [Mahella sp.]MBZ4666023.1 hypothetical protein [Mahella sp.]MDK2903345.1 uncharacterized protein [Clostridiales bacterium]
MLLDHTIDKSWIPYRYGDTKIRLMIKDPYWLYAYWDIKDETQHHAYIMADHRWALRINHISPGASSDSFFIEVGLPTGNWYVYVNRPDSDFSAEIGFILPSGLFVSVAQSNVIHTPRDRASDIYNVYYMDIFSAQYQPTISQSSQPQSSMGSESYFIISSQSMFNRS